MKALLGGLFASFLSFSPALSHDWFTGRTDPTTHHSCCGGFDCNAVPAEWLINGAITETPDGFDVNLTPLQANLINFSTKVAVQDFVPWARVQMSSDDGHNDKGKVGKKSGFAMCIVGGKVQCFFRPPGNS